MSDPLVELTVGPEEGKVIIAFREPQSKLTIHPEAAVKIARSMIDAATKCGFKVTLQVPRKDISGMKRAALVTRCALVMRNQLERGIKPDHLSEQLVDIILSGVA